MTTETNHNTAIDKLDELCKYVHPFQKLHSWHGRVVSFDGTETTMPPLPDVAYILFGHNEGDAWDGKVVGLVRLTDGRYVGWETFYGPTGDGFGEDAYGGDADIIFSGSLDEALRAFTDSGRDIAAKYGFALEVQS